MAKPFATKGEFISFIAEKKSITKSEAESIIDTFVSCTIEALKEGKEIHLIGFRSFTVSDVPGRDGRNPRTAAPLKIEAYKTAKFKAGKNLKMLLIIGKAMSTETVKWFNPTKDMDLLHRKMEVKMFSCI